MDQASMGTEGKDLPGMALDMLAGLSDSMQKSGAPKEAVDMVVQGSQMIQKGLELAAAGSQPAVGGAEMAGGNPNAEPVR